MTTFFGELAKKLAERWVSLLAIPGLLFLTALLVGAQLRWAHAVDADYALDSLDKLAAEINPWSAARKALGVAGVLLAAAAVGLTAGGLAAVVRLIWLGRWPGPLARRRSAARRARWDALVNERFRLADMPDRTAEMQATIDELAARANRLALACPASPTWIGDRFKAVESISHERYGLDLTFTWPAFWLVAPDLVRSEIEAAGSQFADATVRGAWATLYALLALLWPPSAGVAVALGVAAWRRGRSSAAAQTRLLEVALDLHGRALATTLGVSDADTTGPLTPEEGAEITRICRKGR
ncbi:hypothetical protein ACIGBH_11960 [Streptomyces sp. NPDC085929]|uniref:hypothetical protein n=1 Tax=Streptomyces sp. NPDC085929 TaxID=3365739 RepID=UPI0037CECDFA